jgi:hypothetical protein
MEEEKEPKHMKGGRWKFADMLKVISARTTKARVRLTRVIVSKE